MKSFARKKNIVSKKKSIQTIFSAWLTMVRLICIHQDTRSVFTILTSATTTKTPTTKQPSCYMNGLIYPEWAVNKKSDCETCICRYMSGGYMTWDCTLMACTARFALIQGEYRDSVVLFVKDFVEFFLL